MQRVLISSSLLVVYAEGKCFAVKSTFTLHFLQIDLTSALISASAAYLLPSAPEGGDSRGDGDGSLETANGAAKGRTSPYY